MFSTNRRKASAENDFVDLKPFINYLVVLIPVLMISSDFSHLSIDAATLTERGVRTDSVSNITSSHVSLVVVVSDSSVVIADNNRFLKTYLFKNTGFPAEDIGRCLNVLRASVPPEINRITIASDAKVKYQRIIDVMDLAKKNGFGDISLSRTRT